MFAMLARAFRDQQERDHLALVPPDAQRAMEHVPRPTRLIARLELTVARDAIHPLLQLLQFVRQPLEPRRRLRGTREDGDGGVLVHIHAEIDDCASGRHRSSKS